MFEGIRKRKQIKKAIESKGVRNIILDSIEKVDKNSIVEYESFGTIFNENTKVKVAEDIMNTLNVNKNDIKNIKYLIKCVNQYKYERNYYHNPTFKEKLRYHSNFHLKPTFFKNLKYKLGIKAIIGIIKNLKNPY